MFHFSAQIQEKGLQDVELRWETIEKHEFQKQPEEIPGASDVQQCWEGDQDVHQGAGSQLPLPGFRRWVTGVCLHFEFTHAYLKSKVLWSKLF